MNRDIHWIVVMEAGITVEQDNHKDLIIDQSSVL